MTETQDIINRFEQITARFDRTVESSTKNAQDFVAQLEKDKKEFEEKRKKVLA